MSNQTGELKIGIYSPYLHILGGGERYLLSIAEFLSQKHGVYLFSTKSIIDKTRSVFNISLNRVHCLPKNNFRAKNLFRKYILLRQFDIIFFMTDGSLFFPPARKNFLIIQSPIHIPKLLLFNRLKLTGWRIICYSQFMKKIISKELHIEATVLSPCIDTDRLKSGFMHKKNIILTVGRFFPYPHNKKHDVLVDIFKKNYEQYFRGWKFVIVGGLTEEGGREVFNGLKKKSTGFPIEILVNIPFSRLVEVYHSAKIYWHAAGFGEDIKSYPERSEHFGITTIEAMSACAVPIVYNAGGQRDIVTDCKNGFLWETPEELVNRTSQLITDYKLFSQLSKNAEISAQEFSCVKFHEKLDKLIKG